MKWRFASPEADAAGFIAILQCMVRDRQKSVATLGVEARVDDHLEVEVRMERKAIDLVTHLAEYYGGLPVG